MEQFLIYGGYPEVALTPPSQKREVLESIFDLYVKKDLVDFLNIERISHAKTLIHHLAVSHGQEAKYSQLVQVAGVDEKTAKNYLEILRETTADARNSKAAEMIHDEHFSELVRED